MRINGQWYEAVFDDGVRVNLVANSDEEAKKKAPNYYKGKVKEVRSLTQKIKKTDPF